MEGFPDGFQLAKRYEQTDTRWIKLNEGNILPPHLFRTTRGHFFNLDEAKALLTQWKELPVAGVCINCHGSDGYAGGLIAEYGKTFKAKYLQYNGKPYEASDLRAGFENIGLMPKDEVLNHFGKDHGFSCTQFTIQKQCNFACLT